MSCERALDDVVTEFLLNTYLPLPKSRSKYALQAGLHCCAASAASTRDDVPVNNELIPLITGSVAEFYMEPMLPHIGDIDMMYHNNTELAIPRGHPPPTQLPAEFYNYVQVYEIVDSHLPGYAYLELRYLLTRCTDDDNYNAVEYDRQRYLGLNNQHLQSRLSFSLQIHGPAYVVEPSNYSTLSVDEKLVYDILSVDEVFCVRCLLWPPQAADWTARNRNYGWPASATVDRVVSNGCDVVHVAHRQCRQDEWMGMYQWRLSFSRAEVVLINSWMPVQQIVYHMLRHFVKTEGLTDSADNSIAVTLSNYHIKTLMLWVCEVKPRSWWTDDVNLVRMCVNLLHILAEWLTYARCPHYFINNCNVINNSFNLTNVGDQLMSIDEMWLSTWFVDNYIRKCLQLNDCPQNITQLFDDVRVSACVELHDTVAALVARKQNNLLFDLWGIILDVEYFILSFVNNVPLTARSCVCLMTQLPKTDSCLSVYFTAVAFLHVASRSLRHGFNDELMAILATLCGQCPDVRRYRNNSTSVMSLIVAATLMKVVANNSLSTMSLIEIELSKAYLYRALRCKDSDSNSIYCLTNVYLAVLYYTTGQYQKAIEHCTLVTRSQDHSHCSDCSCHVVQGEILPKIDDGVDNMLGLAELYQSIRTAALKQKPVAQLVSIFTTELFAYYLHIKCRSVSSRHFMHTSSSREFNRYGICISDTQQIFIGDVLLFLSVSRLLCHKSVWPKPQRSFIKANECSSSDLVELLQKSAVEHLSTYRQLKARDFASVDTIVTTDYETLYAYKRGDYHRCLQLSTQNVHTLLYVRHMHSVRLLPEFIQLLDDDIVSLTAVTVIINPACRDDYRHTNITQLTLSLYLMTQCQLKLLHPAVTSLAQTLNCIKDAHRKHAADRTLDHLALKLIERKVVSCRSTCSP